MMWMAEYFLPLRVSPICAMASWFGSRMAVSMPFLMPEIRVWPSGMSDPMKAISLIVCSMSRIIVIFETIFSLAMLFGYDRARNNLYKIYDF